MKTLERISFKPVARSFSSLLSFSATGALFFAVALALTGCGGGGSGSGSGSSGTTKTKVEANYFNISNDEYGLMSPNFFYSTNNSSFWSIQADVADDIWDPNFRTIIRIDIQKLQNGDLPDINKSFSIEDNPPYETFPGVFLVFNGHESVYKKVEQGTISFSVGPKASGLVNGVFDVVLTDYDSTLMPPPQYHLKGTFSFAVGTYGPATPLPDEVYPASGKQAYDQKCSACHFLGGYDPTPKSASDLARRGGELAMVFPGAVPEHQALSMDAQTLKDLRVFLNVW
jgi:hypothetical protein